MLIASGYSEFLIIGVQAGGHPCPPHKNCLLRYNTIMLYELSFRLIYQVDSPTSILLLTIYSKFDQEDISEKEIIDIINYFYRD